jgi:CubicO group peptidase (beta-lactamase class C family)
MSTPDHIPAAADHAVGGPPGPAPAVDAPAGPEWPGGRTVSGHADPVYRPVRDAFEELLAGGSESGAALAVIRHGRVVLDLHGGTARAGEPWRPDTLVAVYSVGKPVIALALLVLVDRGLVGLDEPVTRYWPGYGCAGKQGTTVRQVLTHQAGLPAFPLPRPASALADWDLLAGDLAAATPEWPPGTAHGEHALTYGHLVGELVRRVDGRDPGRFVAEEIAGPWGLDLGFGLGSADQRRAADLEYGAPDWPAATLGTPGTLRHRALANPDGCLDLAVLDGPLWRATRVPAVNLHTTAMGCARLYAGLLAGGELDGVRLLRPDTVAQLARVQVEGPDRLLERHVRWGLGVQVDADTGEWGMGGIGGSHAFASPRRGYAMAYVTRRLADHARGTRVWEVLESCLD